MNNTVGFGWDENEITVEIPFEPMIQVVEAASRPVAVSPGQWWQKPVRAIKRACRKDNVQTTAELPAFNAEVA